MSVNDIDIDKVVKGWLQQHENGTFAAPVLRDFIKTVVPEIYGPMAVPPRHPTVDPYIFDEREALAEKTLFAALNRFISNNEDPEVFFESIKKLDKAPTQCGKVFNAGEPTYGCRDCGFDPTCVLCGDCFKKSKHASHRYKMSTSSGGGYCDCGDAEAWKQDVHCENHLKGLEESKKDEPEEKKEAINPQMASRIRIILDILVEYAQQVLTTNDTCSLPLDLEMPYVEPTRNPILYRMRDCFCVILYNDEVHTYDDVMLTLEKAVKCSTSESVQYVTLIDREGSCIVLTGDMNKCQTAKIQMQRSTFSTRRDYRIRIVRSVEATHHIFGMYVLKYISKLLDCGSSVKDIFSDVFFSVQHGQTLTASERLMRSDVSMVKAARIEWHKLVVSGVLMNMEHKIKFAKLYVKNYSAMMDDFIGDDHDHSVCIVSLGVQLFTMPTIAHMLISEESVLVKIIMSFMNTVSPAVENGTLRPVVFQGAGNREIPNLTPMMYKRIQFVMFDVRYILGLIPNPWTDSLRKGFLHGFQTIVKLMRIMQNMDSVTKREGEHVEYERDWEGSFNLQIKLAPVVPLLVQWAASDRIVYIKAMRYLLKALKEDGCKDLNKVYMRESANHCISCIEYDVSKLPVSLHLPLTRLAARLLLALPQHNLEYISPEFPLADRPTMKELIEPILRLTVMVTQVRAGLWKHNGQSLLHQAFFYRNVRCRTEMFDQDIVILQHAAAVMDTNEFLITLLHKFSLIAWQRPDFVQSSSYNPIREDMKKVNTSLEDFLLYLLYIVGERYVLGVGEVTQNQITRREIIHLLCMADKSHSAINKELPETSNNETGIEEVIKEVADFVTSNTDAKGMYQLKPKALDEFNSFFYHFSKEDQNNADYLFRKKNKGDKVLKTPPPPPKFMPAFKPIISIFNSDVFIHILETLQNRFSEESHGSVTEVCAQIGIHLIALAYYEEFSQPGTIYTLDKLLSVLNGILETAKGYQLKPLYSWLKTSLQRLIAAKSDASGASSSMDVDSEDSTAAHEKKVKEENEQLRKKKEAAKQRRALVMGAMMQQQKRYAEKNPMEMQEHELVPSAAEEVAVEFISSVDRIAVGPKQSTPDNKITKHECIVCHQVNTLTLNEVASDFTLPAGAEADLVGALRSCPDNQRLMVMAVLVQPSTVLAKKRKPFDTSEQPVCLPADLHRGIHVSSCGHLMHVSCWKTYHKKIIQKEQQRVNRHRVAAHFDVERNEVLCPMCQRICNDATPVLPPTLQAVVCGLTSKDVPDITPSDWLKILTYIVQNKTQRPEAKAADGTPKAMAGQFNPVSMATVAAEMGQQMSAEVVDNFCRLFNSSFIVTKPSLYPGSEIMMWELAHSIFRQGLDCNPDYDDERILSSVLCSAAYTIHSLEMIKRHRGHCALYDLTDRDRLMISSLVTTAASLPGIVSAKQSSAVTAGAGMTVLMDILGHSDTTILEIDAFSTLVSALCLLPGLFGATSSSAKGGLQDYYLLQLCHFAHIVQILLTYDVLEKEEITKEETVEQKETVTEGAEKKVTPVKLKEEEASQDADMQTPVKQKEEASQDADMQTPVKQKEEASQDADMQTPVKQKEEASQDADMQTPVKQKEEASQDADMQTPVKQKEEQEIGKMEENVASVSKTTTPVEGKKDRIVEEAVESMEVEDPPAEPSSDALWMVSLLKRCRNSLDLPDKEVDAEKLLSCVKERSLPFLRQCGLFFYFLTGCSPPEELQTVEWVPETEYKWLKSYLGISGDLKEYLVSYEDMLDKWLSNPHTKHCVQERTFDGAKVLQINQLITLQEDFSQLIFDCTSFTCPSNSRREDKPSTPSICLVCGASMCSQTYCCQTEVKGNPGTMIGATTLHTDSCCGGSCLFLRVWDCRILLRTGKYRGVHFNSVYVDKYGECDLGLRRGNPLFLNPEMYEKLNFLWMNHLIPETVTHTLSHSTNLGGIEWQHL